jgi:hypothetical protein
MTSEVRAAAERVRRWEAGEPWSAIYPESKDNAMAIAFHSNGTAFDSVAVSDGDSAVYLPGGLAPQFRWELRTLCRAFNICLREAEGCKPT